MKSIVTSIITLLLMSVPAFGKTVTVDVTKPNTMVIDGPITGDSVRELPDRILDQSTKSKVIVLLINSPGGEVYAGLNLIGAMKMAKSRGVRFDCAVTTMAASMAFQILANCDRRYVLNNTFLLWHPVRIGFMGVITPAQAYEMWQALTRIENVLVEDLRKQIDFPEDLFWEHYHAETMWVASDLVKEIPGEFIMVDDIRGISSLRFRGGESPSDYHDLNIINWR